ncbi:MAG: LLM class flavin-dependent oxidoreductase [Alphaproteobacteria bacterium]|jgi:N-acetyl-S-(2-succino)cysteine monooxygenase
MLDTQPPDTLTIPMILAANANAQGSHVGEWRHPDAWDKPAANIANAVRLAQIAEAGKMDLLFLADGNGVRNMDKPDLFAATSPSDRPGVFEPVTLLSALAMVTQHIGLVATTTTTYDEPFHVARRFASLDHISGGRAGWNLVTTSNALDALNFSHAEHVARDTRYERANEFADIVTGLWDSWADDAFPQDKATGQFLDPSKAQAIGHQGKHFQVLGPLNAPRPPQGHPVVFSAGQSEDGRELSARHSDCIFAIEATLPAAQTLYADFKGRLGKYGRTADDLKILAGVTIFVGETEQQADDLAGELDDLVPPAVGVDYLSKMTGLNMKEHPVDGPMPNWPEGHHGPTGIANAIVEVAQKEGLTVRQTYKRILPQMAGNMFKGDPIQVADVMEEWFRGKGCDGFMIAAPVVPTGMERFTRLVIPELQRRGLFRREYEGGTLRENLGLRRPVRRNA